MARDATQTKKRAKKSGNWIHFRAPTTLTEKLDAAAAALGQDRSNYARLLLEQGLGLDAEQAVIQQAIFRVTPAVNRTVKRLLAQLVAELPNEILRDFAAWAENAPTAPPPPKKAPGPVRLIANAIGELLPAPADEDDTPILPEDA